MGHTHPTPSGDIESGEFSWSTIAMKPTPLAKTSILFEGGDRDNNFKLKVCISIREQMV